MIDAPPLPPPAIVAPGPREVSFGHVSGTVPGGTRRIVVQVGQRVLADRPLRGPRFSLTVELPRRELTLRVTAHDASGRSAAATVGPVYGLPPAAAPRWVTPRLDASLADELRRLTENFEGVSAVYVQDLRRGRGAAWNAGARFPAASTLKLAIAVTVLARASGKPARGSPVEQLLRAMLVASDNRAANELELWLGGSISAGSARVNELMWSLGMGDSLMYGGYEPTPLRRPAALQPIPIRVESPPAFEAGKYTSAADLATLLRSVYLAAGAKGPLLGRGVSPSEARYLLWLLAGVTDRGKLARFLAGPEVLLHKAGWLATARHDAGIVLWPGGALVAAVLTWQPNGAGIAADVLAGRVAAAALRRLR